MTAEIQTRSATIYQFPVGGRAGLLRHKPESKSSPDRSTFAAGIVVGSSWYHDEAIQDAERERERARKSRQ